MSADTLTNTLDDTTSPGLCPSVITVPPTTRSYLPQGPPVANHMLITTQSLFYGSLPTQGIYEKPVHFPSDTKHYSQNCAVLLGTRRCM
ncbi:hypothetical protein I4U23_010299 [Adineta vaga]|nr:hypothetical protein I4U23_010299 [Adineta vaga]